MKMFSRMRIVSAGLCIAVAVTIGSAHRSLRAALFPVAGFEIHDVGEQRLYIQPNENELFPGVSRSLGGAVRFVEEALGRAFPDQVSIVVHGDQEGFNRWTGAPASGRATGAVFMGRVHISPRASQLGAVENVLVHELAHLHFRQVMGTLRYTTGLPRWFQEASAMSLARSHTPDPFAVSADSALAALDAGQHFVPEATGRWGRPRSGRDYGISEGLFYRQVELFSRFLSHSDSASFGALLQDVEGGRPLEDAVGRHLGSTLAKLWQRFKAGEGFKADPNPLGKQR